MQYAIIDVETTGYGGAGARITDIAVFIHDGKNIIEEFQTFINPETYIPENITRLTRITNEMVASAPKFYEVAKKIFQLTQGKVFVAHNVNFDYNIIRKEFARLGGAYELETLCTIKLSRRLIPGFKSYSLGNLCNELNIDNKDAHRAYGDARATVELFELLVEKSQELGENDLKPIKIKKQINLPPMLEREVYDQLPETFGVYYFHNAEDEIIYVGKANNIKQRVASHFNDKKRKEQQMFEQTANITYKLCGSELISLLFESAEIKRLFPMYNRSQKKLVETHLLFSYENGGGVTCLAIGSNKQQNEAVATFYNVRQAKNILEALVKEFELCPKYCGLEQSKGACFASGIKKCKGVCANQEPIDDYNQRVAEAMDSLRIPKKDFLILEDGRTGDEMSVISVKDGVYQGFGFCESTQATESEFSALIKCIDDYPDNSDSRRIIRVFLKNNKAARVLFA